MKSALRFSMKWLAACAVLTFAASLPAAAADWSDTSISYRTGNKFAEPFITEDISKDIIGLTHVSGFKYGTNFFNVDLLMSDENDPASCATACQGSAQEVYVVYRNTLDIGKIAGKDLKWGIIRGWGATWGFDFNAKTDAGYNSKKRMFVAGATAMFDVPGFLNVSLLELWESNAPCSTFSGTCVGRYKYDPHPMLTASWGIPLGGSGFSFEGFVNFIAAKGTDEFGNETKPETNFDAQIMFDMSRVGLGSKGMFKLGVEYQYWKNKFGNDASGPAGSGAFAKTPMVRAEYHF